MPITQKQVKELFDYRDGELYWKESRGNRVRAGDLAGYVQNNGYRAININNKLYKAHRLIFLYHHGYLPKTLDHIDGDRLNNSIGNLREATNGENQMNRKKNKSMNEKTTTSKYKGVTWDKDKQKWRSRIQNNKKLKHLGYFKSEIDAALAYDKAAEANGEFAKTNKSLGLLPTC